MNGSDAGVPPSGSEMPTVIGWPAGPASRVLPVLAVLRPQAATAALAAVTAASRKVLARGRLIGFLLPCQPARAHAWRWCAERAGRAPRTTPWSALAPGRPWVDDRHGTWRTRGQHLHELGEVLPLENELRRYDIL